MSCPVVDMAPASMDGKAFTATLDRFGHTQSGGGQLMHAMHTSGHTVSSSTLKRPARLGGAQRTVCPVG
jgi:hypothetical protein